MAKTVLVTGGAGYIGSHTCKLLFSKGFKPVVYDNLSQGHRYAVKWGDFVEGSLDDTAKIGAAIKKYRPCAVLHFAASAIVQESRFDPEKYYTNNVCGTLSLLGAMLETKLDKIIFSSSAAAYGEPEVTPIEENHSRVPVNSYGESKLMFEHVLAWYGKAYGLKHVSFRYFNAAGASELLGEDHRPETHLIPNVLKAASNNNSPVNIFGTDYPTKDGSCVRDYVHVIDIARAHMLALERLEAVNGGAFNLGNGDGFSVLEVVEAAKKVAGVNIPVKAHSRRSGDPAVLVANSIQAKTELGWEPEFSEIEGIIDSAWNWMRKHPNGYEQ